MADQLLGGALARRRKLWLMAVLLPITAIALCSVWFGSIFRHRTTTSAPKAAVRIARTILPADVKSVFVSFGGSNIVILTAEKDARDIERVVNSLRRVTVVADREYLPDLTDTIQVSLKSGEGVRLLCRFDPDCAPIISSSMRSDDLSAILYDISRRRGIEPRRR